MYVEQKVAARGDLNWNLQGSAFCGAGDVGCIYIHTQIQYAAAEIVARQQNTGNECPVRKTAVAWKLYNALPCNFGLPVKLYLHFHPHCSRIHSSLFNYNNPFDGSRVYPRYIRPIVLTMAETDGDKFPLHTAAREGRGTELHAYIPALQS